MAKVYLENAQLMATFDTKGAELLSVKRKNRISGELEEQEYIWSGDPKYWGRHAPILFPFVGTQKGKQYQHKGIIYPMTQHGFARDKEFVMQTKEKNRIWFKLSSDEETKKCYPFEFILWIGYELEEDTIQVFYRVENYSKEKMYFAIGAHPGFTCPLVEGTLQEEYSFRFPHINALTYSIVNMENGLKRENTYQMDLVKKEEYGYLKLEKGLFDRDALIIEQSRINEVALCKADNKPYVIVKFDTPLFGLWSPAGKNAPFVCIEPWYGRCDSEEFDGELSEKEYINELDMGESFERSYSMQFLP